MADPRMRQCQHCGQQFVLSVGQSRRDTESRRYQAFCSRDCFHASRRKPPQPPAPRHCRGCRAVLIEPRALLCSGCRRPPIRPKVEGTCECGARIVGTAAKRLCSMCTKRNRHQASKRRKLIERGVRVETVDPMRVLERDRWRCQLCGRSTPRRLRGTIKPNAPELDHIVPISKGGAHSYLNTQCACR